MERIQHYVQTRFDQVSRRLLPPVLEPGAMPWMSLFYLSFLVMPLFVPKMPQPDWALTVLATATFLPVYFYFYWSRGWRRIGTLVVMASLCAALLPANSFSNCFLIYANVLAAFLPWRQMLGVFAFAQLLCGASIVWLGLDEDKTQAILLMGTLPAALAMFCNRFYIATMRKNQVLRLSQDEVQRLARVAERERISRDLHDLLGHTLSVVALKAELATKLFSRDPAAAAREMADVERVAREALGQVRRAVSGMRALGLRAELANARLALAAVEVDFEYRADDLQLHPEIETTLALTLREATTNVIRHAQAHRARCDLVLDRDVVRLTLKDDGIGGANVAGNGLSGMRERVEALGGTMLLKSKGGEGTAIEIAVPYREMPREPLVPSSPPKLVAVN